MYRHQTIFGFIIIVLLLLVSACSSNKHERIHILSESGWQEADSFNFSNKKCVFIFFDSECPVCNLYTNTLSSLSSDYQSIEWFLIIPKHSDTSNYENFGFKGSVLYDRDNYLVKKYKATTTPQVFLVNKDITVYSGKIDDKVKALGSYKENPDTYYLRDAIEALLKKEEPQIKYTKPVGCLIQ